jgi:hypothetical protein
MSMMNNMDKRLQLACNFAYIVRELIFIYERDMRILESV